MRVYIIGEAGVNHNGKLDLALKLCDIAKEASLDAVKFQTFKTEKIITQKTEMAEYQKKNLNQEKSQFDMIKELELSYDDFFKIKEHCENIGIEFLSTPDENESLDFLCDQLNISKIKISSGDVDNLPYLKKIAQKKKDVILSTGMSYLSEIETAYYTLINNGAKSVSLLHCTTNYPCPMEDVNLKVINTLKNIFPSEIGYSDHTIGDEVPVAAVAMGATIIEKHFTIDKTMPGPDHSASMEPKELTAMVKKIRNIEKAMGNGLKKPTLSEENIKKVVRKSIVASKNIKLGEKFNENNLTLKRADLVGLSGIYWDLIINRPAQKNYKED